MDARQSTSYLPPTTGPINQAMEDYSAFSFTHNYPQLYQLASHESTPLKRQQRPAQISYALAYSSRWRRKL